MAHHTLVYISSESLQVAIARNPDADFVECDVSAGLPPGPFDCVAAISSVEFCYDKRSIMRNIHAVLKPDGRFYVEVRNGNFLLTRLPDRLRTGLEKAGLLATYPAYGFRDLSYKEWVTLLEESGFNILKVTRSCRPILYGGTRTLAKNALIGFTRIFFPITLHYMVGFLCKKVADP